MLVFAHILKCCFPSIQILGSNKQVFAKRTLVSLQDTIAEIVPEKQQKLAELKKNHGSQV